ncbi:MAG: hypothetical protein U0703_11825 [Anaerolineae bacterium]
MQQIDLYPQNDERLKSMMGEMLGEEPTIRDVFIHDSAIGAWTEIGRGTHISRSTFGDFWLCSR